jgi:tripartite-type tricarboxylate transporter receptor subunit TctC
MLAQRSGASMAHVPYKGSSEALPALVGGHVSLYADTIVTALPLIKSGKIKPLAVTSSKRSSLLPNVPTVAEQGYPGYDMVPWLGVVAPLGTPREVVERLRTAMAKVMQTQDFTNELAQAGAELPPDGLGPAEFANLLKADIPRTGKLVKDIGIEPQ